jgi:hypothetical protein
MKKYHAYFHDGRFIPAIDENGKQDMGMLDWDDTMKGETKELGRFDTVDEALEAYYASPSNGVWNSFVIEDEEYGEVYSDTLEYVKCPCCGDEKYSTVTSDMRRMKARDGSLLFPYIV